MRLHRGGRFRTWLGARLGGGPELGDRIWRRILHGLGALVLIYFLLPPNVLFGWPNWSIALIALAAIIVLEGCRLTGRIEVPATRSYEEHRPASYAYFGAAIVAAILLFPEPIAVAVVLGTALVDPLAGELRGSTRYRPYYPWVPFLVYAALASVALVGVGHAPWAWGLGLGLLSAAIALAVEFPKSTYVDDDLAMTLVPAIVLDVFAYFVRGLL